MRNRIFVALLAIPFFILAIFLERGSGWPFLALLLVAGLFSVIEYLDLVGEGFSRFTRMVSIAGTIFMIIAWYGFRFGFGVGSGSLVLSIPVVAFIPFLLLSVGIVLRPTFANAFRELALGYIPVVYIGIGFGSLIGLHGISPEGPFIVLYAFLVVWLTDSFALFCGTLFGRHNLRLAASPNKTVEGLVGGVFFALVGAVVLKLIWPAEFSGSLLFTWPVFLTVTLALSLIGQLGDLTESVLKRSLGVKDSGSSVPGHGGALDVFDAQLFVSPALYLLVVWMYHIR